MATKRLKGKSYREAAAVLSPKKTPRLTMEVLITARKPSNSMSNVEDSDDDDAGRPSKRRAAKNTPIIISDDEEEITAISEYEDGGDEDDQQSFPGTKTTVSGKKQSKPKGPPSSATSDYEDISAEVSESEGDRGGTPISSDAESRVKRKPFKSKPTAKRANGSKTTSSKAVTDSDDMDVDEPVAPKVNGAKPNKRKATDDQGIPKKQKRREDGDPWKLESAAVKREWTLMQAPPMEMFHFARVVVDEYTYLDGKAHALITSLTAERYWVLSGTPPIHDFTALKTIAAFLDVHLGVDDDAESKSAQVKKRWREQTGEYAIRLVSKISLMF